MLLFKSGYNEINFIRRTYYERKIYLFIHTDHALEYKSVQQYPTVVCVRFRFRRRSWGHCANLMSRNIGPLCSGRHSSPIFHSALRSLRPLTSKLDAWASALVCWNTPHNKHAFRCIRTRDWTLSRGSTSQRFTLK